MCRAHDGEMAPSANAADTAGWAARRFIQPTAPAAAPLVTWVCHLSQARSDCCPSSSCAPLAANALSIRACAAVYADSALASSRKQSACTIPGRPPAGTWLRKARLARNPVSASATVAGGCPVHTWPHLPPNSKLGSTLCDPTDNFWCSTCGNLCGTFYGMTTTVEELMKSATDARRVAQNALRVAVREARAADWSWDRISAALGGSPNGETLRRNFGGDE